MNSLQHDLLIDSTESVEELQFYLPDPLELASGTTIPSRDHHYGHGISAVKERALWYFSRPVQAMRRRRVFRQARIHY